jgi:hypothetical protein
MNKIILSANDIKEITKVIEEYKVDYFTLTRNNVSAIGYCIDLEYSTTINGRMCTVIVPVVGTEKW